MSVVITCSTIGLDPRVASTPDTILAMHHSLMAAAANEKRPVEAARRYGKVAQAWVYMMAISKRAVSMYPVSCVVCIVFDKRGVRRDVNLWTRDEKVQKPLN